MNVRVAVNASRPQATQVTTTPIPSQGVPAQQHRKFLLKKRRAAALAKLCCFIYMFVCENKMAFHRKVGF